MATGSQAMNYQNCQNYQNPFLTPYCQNCHPLLGGTVDSDSELTAGNCQKVLIPTRQADVSGLADSGPHEPKVRSWQLEETPACINFDGGHVQTLKTVRGRILQWGLKIVWPRPADSQHGAPEV
jgi:hypothetical protein